MRKLCILTLILIFLVALPASAKMKKLGQAGMTFLNIGGSARAAGMGGVFNHVQGDLASVFYNPAGLATVDKRSFFFNMTNWLVEMKVYHMAVSWNLDKYGVFALQAQTMDYGDIYGTVINETDPKGYTETGTLSDLSGLSVGLSYGRQMTDKFFIGGTIRLVNQKLGLNDTYSGGALEKADKQNEEGSIAFDFGTVYHTGIRSLMVTMSIRNYAGQLLYENEEFGLPQTYKVGLAANLFELLPFSPGEDHAATLAIEGIDQRDRDAFMNVGLEYTLKDMVMLRGGWAAQRVEDGLGGICAGAGVKLDMASFAGRVDVSYSDYGDILGSVLRVSVGGSF